MIKIGNLNKYFNRGSKNELHVLQDINLEFARTGLVCILGESGSGKTTLLNTLGGLDTFANGSIQIDDTILKKYQPSKIEPLRNEKFGYVFQNYFLLQDFSVEYNVKLALNLYHLTEEEKDARVEYVLQQLGISRYKKKLVSKLSGGQQQRVSIARALVKSPEIILADEPTGNLDEENTIRIMSILKNISRECLVILVSHERRIADFFADRIIEIKDGQIIKDVQNNVSGTYERGDDANIYLRELEKVTLENEQGHFEMYQNPDSEDPQICLKLAWKNGKLYVQNAMECDVILEGEESGCRILDQERPKLDMSDVDDFSYDLEKLPSQKSATLSHREILRMALENIRLMGRKQAFVIAVVLATAVLLTLTLADYINAISVNETEIVEDDSHYAKLYFNREDYYDRETVDESVGEEYDKYLKNSEFIDDLFIDPKDDLSLEYHGFRQLGNLSGGFQNFSYVSTKHLQEKDLIYGQMPEKYNEIVVDRLVIERFLASDDILASMYDDVEDFLGQSLLATVYDQTLRIVGISDTQEASIYCGQNVLLSFSMTASRVASVGDLQKEYPGQYDDMALENKQILVTESEYQDIVDEIKRLEGTVDSENIFHTIYDTAYRVVGTIPDDAGFDYIMNDEMCKGLRRRFVVSTKQCYIYMEDPDTEYKQIQALAKKMNKEYGDITEVKVSMPYRNQIKEYKKARTVDLDTKKMIAVVIFFVSLIMIYFTIKSNAISRSEELTVYRLLGIGKGSILRAYMLEMFIINTYTSLPAVLITSWVLKFVSAIPSLEIQLIFPWWAAALLLVALYLVNIIISILPVHHILSKPPAKLALKN